MSKIFYIHKQAQSNDFTSRIARSWDTFLRGIGHKLSEPAEAIIEKQKQAFLEKYFNLGANDRRERQPSLLQRHFITPIFEGISEGLKQRNTLQKLVKDPRLKKFITQPQFLENPAVKQLTKSLELSDLAWAYINTNPKLKYTLTFLTPLILLLSVYGLYSMVAPRFRNR